jgi:hypothetical protein
MLDHLLCMHTALAFGEVRSSGQGLRWNASSARRNDCEAK